MSVETRYTDANIERENLSDESDQLAGIHQSAVVTARLLMESMNRSGITELDLTFADVSIRLRGGSPVLPSIPAIPAVTPIAATLVETRDEGHVVAAPMVGTFYVAPTPHDPPFVSVGDYVSVGQTIGIIEAMKIMNEIAADRTGRVAAFLAENAEAVEYGSPLVRIVPNGDSAA